MIIEINLKIVLDKVNLINYILKKIKELLDYLVVTNANRLDYYLSEQ